MLKTEFVKYYQAREGQTLEEIAKYFSVSPYLLAAENKLTEGVRGGQVLVLPSERGNLYTVREGDTKVLLCGSEENFRRKNGTDIFYIGMRVIL